MEFLSHRLDNSGKLVSIQKKSPATVLFGYSRANEAMPTAMSS